MSVTLADEAESEEVSAAEEELLSDDVPVVAEELLPEAVPVLLEELLSVAVSVPAVFEELLFSAVTAAASVVTVLYTWGITKVSSTAYREKAPTAVVKTTLYIRLPFFIEVDLLSLMLL